MERDVPKYIVDDALQVLLSSEERDNDSSSDMIEIYEFIAIIVRVIILPLFEYQINNPLSF